MIDRLHRALEHIDELAPELQEQLAEIIEQHTEPVDLPVSALAGAWSDLPSRDVHQRDQAREGDVRGTLGST
jgi:hypothetical protein